MKVGIAIAAAILLIVWGVMARLDYCRHHVCIYQPPAPCLRSHSETSTRMVCDGTRLGGVPVGDSCELRVVTDSICDEFGPTPQPVRVRF